MDMSIATARKTLGPRSPETEPAGLFDGYRVHRDAYLDQQVFDLEMVRIFERCWVYIGAESEVESPGDFKLTTMGQRQIILSRAEDGGLYVFENRCPHRGAAICQRDYGNTRFFRCPYHGWTFRNDGSLAAVTYPDRYEHDLRSTEDYAMRRVAEVESYRGLVFARLRSGGPTLLEHLGGAKDYLDLKIDAGLRGLSLRSGSQRLGVKFNWKIQLENTVDGYHANFVHRDALTLFSGGGADGNETIDMFGPGSSSSENVVVDLGNGHSIIDLRPGMSDDVAAIRGALPLAGSDVYYQQLVELYGESKAIEVVKTGVGDGINLSIFPNLQLLVGQVRVIRPRTPNVTEVDLYPTWFDGAPEEFNVARLRAHSLTYGPGGLIQPDDLEIFRRVGVGLGHSRDGWVDLSRGSHLDQPHADGTIMGQVTDESPQRGFWRHWAEVMAGNE
jgi:nitrite reductase/ring-hydroxylating ferredoxin subunit